MEQQTKIGSLEAVVIDVNDIDRAARFWSLILGARPVLRSAPYMQMELPEGPPRILLQHVPEPNSTKARLHLDVGVADLETSAQQVEALGGRRLRNVEENGNRFVVMADTEGNEFCLVPLDT